MDVGVQGASFLGYEVAPRHTEHWITSETADIDIGG